MGKTTSKKRRDYIGPITHDDIEILADLLAIVIEGNPRGVDHDFEPLYHQFQMLKASRYRNVTLTTTRKRRDQ